MESKKINQLATNVNPQTSDLTTIGDPITGQLKKITWLQVAHLIGAQAAVTLQQVTDNGNTTTDPITTGGLTLTNLGTGVPQLTNGNFAGTYGYGLANGVATLDSGGKIPASQLPSSVMEYKGTWNASTNTPTLADGTGDNGDVYLVNVAGSQNLGSGTISFAVGDWVVYNGTIWQKSLNSNAVASVFGRTGTIVAQEGDYNIDQLGDVAITSAATNDYLRYNGSSWVNTQFPTFVSSDKLVLQVRNNSGATINKGTVVYINGATAGYPTIAKALADSDATSAQTIGMVQDNISNNSNGVVVIVGQITGIDTSAYTAGTQLYLSGTTAGTVTSTKPYAPLHLVYVGIVTAQNAVNGVIEVKVQNGVELEELHNVDALNPNNNDGIFYNSTSELWEHKSIATVLGYTPEQPLTFSAPLSRSTNTISIPAATGSVNGYLTSTDWTTFNNKQNAITNPVTGTGTQHYIAKFTATGSTIGDSSLYYSQGANSNSYTFGSVGAGAIYNLSQFNIYSNSTSEMYFQWGSNKYLYIGDASGNISISAMNTGTHNYNNIIYYNGSSASDRYLSFQTEGQDRIFIKQAGQVLINTSTFNTSFNAALVVKAPSGTNSILEITSGGLQSSLYLTNATTTSASYPAVEIFNSGNFGIVAYRPTVVSSNYVIYYALESSTNRSLEFQTEGTARIFINQGGNVSIGSTNNTYKLDVNGTGNFTGALSGTSATFTLANDITLTARSGAAGSYTYWSLGRTSSELELGVAAAANQFFTGTAAGDVIIKANGSSNKLMLGYGSGSPTLTLAASGAATFSSSVGVGGTNTDSLLTVNGTAGTSHERFREGSTTVGFVGGANGIITGHNGKLALRAESGLILSGTGNSPDVIIASGGAATFSSSVTASGAKSQLIVSGDSGSGAGILLNTALSGTNRRNWFIGTEENVEGDFVIKCSTAAGGNANAGNTRLSILNNGNVGIGTTSPGRKLEVVVSDATAYTTSSSGNVLGIGNISPTTNSFSGITFYAEPTSGNAGVSAINNIVTGSGDAALAFSTRGGSTLAERMRITSGGNVLIGKTTNAGGRLQVSNGTNTFNVDHNADGPYLTGATDNNVNYRRLSYDATEHVFLTSATERMRITSGGVVQIANSSGTNAAIQASERLNVNGTVYSTGYFEISDIRKKDVQNTFYSDNINAISYLWKDKSDDKLHIGYAAQQVQQYIPDAVMIGNDGTLSLDYNQVHTWKIAQLEKEILELKAKING